ncbi:MAG TPA: efflux RND transporter periplasmic adaptor subunit [Ktedonosporobacter sp.]|nr:efflux RND transporter periplasmic adaptor subunit [Ktedonosporobacter sp.]
MKKNSQSPQKSSLPPESNALSDEEYSSGDEADQTSASVSVIQAEDEKKTNVALPAFHPDTPGIHSFQQIKKKNKPALLGGLLVVLLVLGGGLWWLKSGIIPPDVSLYQVGGENDVTLSIGGGGLVYAHQELNVTYPTAEQVLAVKVKAGDHVTPNQSLMQIDPSQINVAIKQANDDLAAAQSYLYSVSVSGTSVNIAQAQQAYELAKDRYNALVAQSSSPLLHDGNLVSPMNGVVTSVDVNAGEVFQPNTTLITIMDETSVVVRVKVPLANLGQVHLGQDAIVTPSALANVNIPGTVSNLIPQADPQTDTFEVWVSIPNQGRLLLPGMSAFVRIETPARSLTVPRLAVISPEGDAAVFVVRNQIAHLQNVKVVGRSVDTIYIGEGLSMGDQVVLVGLDGLRDGQRVHVTHIEHPQS